VPDFSIIICTYNPEIRLIKRCLQAIQKLQTSGFSYETLLVDNNCTIPIKKNAELAELFKGFANIKLLLEPNPGLSNARIAGVQNATSPWIVFFDDDNEASPDYLIQLSSIILNYPAVGIWGPGEVKVDFVDKTTPWIEKNCRDTFQEKKLNHTEYALQQGWNACYPPGSGICIRKDIFIRYIELYTSNKFKTTGRIGNSLVGAEDNQIIHTSILMGLAVGTYPGMKLNHLIPASKSNFSYIKKLRFFTRYSVPQSAVEFFPDTLQKYKNTQRSQFSLFLQLHKYLLTGILKSRIKESIIDCILIAGNYAGINLVLNRKNPYWLKLFLKTFGIELK